MIIEQKALIIITVLWFIVFVHLAQTILCLQNMFLSLSDIPYRITDSNDWCFRFIKLQSIKKSTRNEINMPKQRGIRFKTKMQAKNIHHQIGKLEIRTRQQQNSYFRFEITTQQNVFISAYIFVLFSCATNSTKWNQIKLVSIVIFVERNKKKNTNKFLNIDNRRNEKENNITEKSISKARSTFPSIHLSFCTTNKGQKQIK